MRRLTQLATMYSLAPIGLSAVPGGHPVAVDAILRKEAYNA